MRGERSRHRWPTLPWAAAALALAALLVSPARTASAQQEPCECKHLDAIRQQIAKRQAMRDYYQRAKTDLEAKEAPILQGQDTLEQKEAKLRELTQESERAVAGDTETLIRFDSQTCEAVPEDLAREKAAAPCQEAAEAAAHHEDYHHDVCVRRHRRQEPQRTTRPISNEMVAGMGFGIPSADRWEEVESYDLEIAELRRLVEKLSADLQYVLIFKSVARMDWKVPMGPMGVAAEYGSTASVPLEITEGPAPQSVSGHATRSFEGRVIGGACQYTGMPMALPMTVDGTLDDGVLKLRIDKDGQRMSPFGVRCPNGAGMSVPSMAPPVPVTVELEARDGARLVYPYATSFAATMMSGVGTLSGDAVLEIEVVCKPKR